MADKKLTIYLTLDCIYRIVYSLPASSENSLNIDDVSFVELRDFALPRDTLSGKDQIEINNIVKEWTQEFKQEYSESAEIDILISDEFSNSLFADNVFEVLGTLVEGDLKQVSPLEESRQSLLCVKNFFIESNPNAQQIYHLTLKPKHLSLMINEADSFEFLQESFGIADIAEFINETLRKGADLKIIKTYAQGKVQRLREQALLGHAVNAIAVDEDTSRLLIRILQKDVQAQNIYLSELKSLVDQFIETDFQYLSKNDFIEDQSFIYFSAYITLLTCILEALGVKTLIAAPDQRLRGYICHQLIESGNAPEIIGFHRNDYSRQAKMLLMRHAPELLNSSMHSAALAESLFRSGDQKLHFWGHSEYKCLWLATFLYRWITREPQGQYVTYLRQLPTLYKREIEMINIILSVLRENTTFAHSKYLDKISVHQRLTARQMIAMARTVLAFDVTDRSAVNNLMFENSENGKLILRVIPRIDIEPERVHFEGQRQQFESSFDRKVELLT